MCRILFSAYLANNQDLDSGNRIILSLVCFQACKCNMCILHIYFVLNILKLTKSRELTQVLKTKPYFHLSSMTLQMHN